MYYLHKNSHVSDKNMFFAFHQKQINPGEVLILYSDGVRSQLNRDEFPAFFELSAYDIARITIDYFSKTLDDASCIVVKVADD